MRLEQLENIIEIASCRSINRAAIDMHMAQQSLMSGLNSLEDELGFKIFERSRKGVSLTEKGSIFLEEARTVVQICHGWQRFREDATNEPQTLTISMVSAFRQQISELCMDVHTAYGDKLELKTVPCYLNSNLNSLLDTVRPNFLFYLDTNFHTFPLAEQAQHLLATTNNWEHKALYQRPCEIFLPANHSWIQEGKRFVTFTDLEKQTLIFNSNTSVPVFSNVEKIFLPNKEGVLQAVLTGKGIGVSLNTTITDQFYLDTRQIIALPLYLTPDNSSIITFNLLYHRQTLMTTVEKDILRRILHYYQKI